MFRLLIQWASTMTSNSLYMSTVKQTSSSHGNVTYSCHDKTEQLLTWHKTTITICNSSGMMFVSYFPLERNCRKLLDTVKNGPFERGSRWFQLFYFLTIIRESLMWFCLLQVMQHDMWGVKDTGINDWEGLRKKIAK